MDSALVTAPFGKRRDEARNCPTSVRLQRLSIQSFSSCAPGSRPATAGVPAARVGRASCPSLVGAGTEPLSPINCFSEGRRDACPTLGLHGLPSRKSAPSVNCQGG